MGQMDESDSCVVIRGYKFVENVGRSGVGGIIPFESIAIGFDIDQREVDRRLN